MADLSKLEELTKHLEREAQGFPLVQVSRPYSERNLQVAYRPPNQDKHELLMVVTSGTLRPSNVLYCAGSSTLALETLEADMPADIQSLRLTRKLKEDVAVYHYSDRPVPVKIQVVAVPPFEYLKFFQYFMEQMKIKSERDSPGKKI